MTDRVDTTETDNPPPDSAPVPALEAAWERVGGVRRLGEVFAIHRGIQRISAQADARSAEKRPGYRPGVCSSRGAAQFAPPRTVMFVDARPDRVRGAALGLPWGEPKIVLSGWSGWGRPWRLSAARDRAGLLLSQQFIALWPRKPLSDAEFMGFVAVLNGPVANAFVAARNGDGNIRSPIWTPFRSRAGTCGPPAHWRRSTKPASPRRTRRTAMTGWRGC